MREQSRPHGRGPAGRELSSARKCLELVELMATRRGPSALSDLARTLGAPRGSIHQRLATLVSAGWVEQSDDARYKLSHRLAVIGVAALEQANLGAAVRDVMNQLAANTRERVDLAVLSASDAVVVERVESTQPLRAEYPVGTHLPLADSAAGKVLVAFTSDATRDELRRLGIKLPAEAELEAIRSANVSIAIDRVFPGIAAASAPVFDARGKLLAALSLAAPSSRFNAPEAADLVVAAARKATIGLAHPRAPGA